MAISSNTHGTHQLRQERIRHNWRQQDLAEQLGTTVVTVKRWEGGSQQPSAYFRFKLCALFGKSAEELGLIPSSPPEEASRWSVPFLRNPFFTGRDLVLDQLHTILTNKPTIAALTQSYALSGLGGIGKTQLAIEYAYRHRREYQAVFWIEAETQTSLTSSFVRLAALLVLPEKAEEDQSKVVAAVLRWLNRNEGWLLIFDNVEDLSLVRPFLPASDQGALLLTTRLQTLGTLAQRINLPPLTLQEGYAFLLARTSHLRQGKERAAIDPQEKAAAQAIVTEMGGLPLALEQVGAFIDSTQCGLSDYLRLFQDMQHRLLDEHELSNGHPLSVSRTFSLAFEQVAQRNPLATELLTACAFLAPDAIPEMFFLEGASSLGPTFKAIESNPMAFPEALKVLLSYSLLQRSASTRTITVHRLVQVVLKGWLTEAEQRSRGRMVVATMVRLFPYEELQTNYLSIGEQLVPHAQACLALCDQWSDEEALFIPLMSHVAVYLFERVRYTEAEPLFERAIHMGTRVLGVRHSLVAEALHGLANLYRRQGRYTEAEPLFERALCIREEILEKQHPLIATSLDILGYCYHQHGKNEQAEPFLQRALHIREQVLAPEHPQIAISLNSLGILYFEQGEYEQAELLYQRSLRIWEQALGPEHPQIAISLNNLGELYFEQGKYEQAEYCYQRALHIRERVLGLEHLDVAFPLHGLANLFREQGKYEQAEPLYLRALMLRQQHLNSPHPDSAEILHDLACLYHLQQQTSAALSLYQQALAIRKQAYGSQHPKVEETRSSILRLLQEMRQSKEEISEESLAPGIERSSLCACGCGHQIDRSKSRGEPKRFFSKACKQRFYRNAQRKKRNMR